MSVLLKTLLYMLMMLMSSSCCSAYRLLMIQGAPTETGLENQRVMQRMGEQLVAQHDYHVTQLFWSSSPAVESSTSSIRLLQRTLKLPEEQLHAPTPLEQPIWRSWWSLTAVVERTAALCRDALSSRLLMRLKTENFDVVLVDMMTNECGLLLARRLQLPVVGFWGERYAGLEADENSAPNLPSSYPAASSGLPPEMDFLQRAFSLLVAAGNKAAREAYFLLLDRRVQEVDAEAPPVRSLVRDVQVMLLHGSYLTSQALQLPPTSHMLGCLECELDRHGKLSQQLQRYADASDGYIVAKLNAEAWENDKSQENLHLLPALAQRPEKVIILGNSTSPRGLPSNVFTPQLASPLTPLLRHKKALLLITSCSMSDVLQALHHGIPVLCLPRRYPHRDTAGYLAARRLGLSLHHLADVKETSAALQQLLDDDDIRRRARFEAEVSRHGFRSPAQRLHHWVSMAAKFRRLDHLQLIGREMPWYQYWMVDVLLVNMTLILLIMAVGMMALVVFGKMLIRFVSRLPVLKNKSSKIKVM